MALALDFQANLAITTISYTTALSHDSYFYYIMTDPIRGLLYLFALTLCSCMALLRGVSLRTLIILFFVLVLVLIEDSQPIFACLSLPPFMQFIPSKHAKDDLLTALETLRLFDIHPVINPQSTYINTLDDILGFHAVDKIYDEKLTFYAEDMQPFNADYLHTSVNKHFEALFYALHARARMAKFTEMHEVGSKTTLLHCREIFKRPEIQSTI